MRQGVSTPHTERGRCLAGRASLNGGRVKIWDRNGRSYGTEDGEPWVLWDGGPWFANQTTKGAPPIIMMSGKLQSGDVSQLRQRSQGHCPAHGRKAVRYGPTDGSRFGSGQPSAHT